MVVTNGLGKKQGGRRRLDQETRRRVSKKVALTLEG